MVCGNPVVIISCVMVSFYTGNSYEVESYSFVNHGNYPFVSVPLQVFLRLKRKKEKNMKRMIVVLLVLIIAMAAFIPVGAQGGSNGNGTGGTGSTGGSGTGQVRNGWFTMTGTVVGLNTQTRTVTMYVIRTNTLARTMIGQQVQIRLTLQTRYAYNYRVQNRTRTQTSTMSALQVGQSINVQGNVYNQVWTCSRLTIGASMGVLP